MLAFSQYHHVYVNAARQLESQKVMQFLMGLSEEYSHSKDQILMLDPIPSLSRVYSMILKVEKHRLAHMVNVDHMDMTTLPEKAYGSTSRQHHDSDSVPPFRTKGFSSSNSSGGRSLSTRKGVHTRAEDLLIPLFIFLSHKLNLKLKIVVIASMKFELNK